MSHDGLPELLPGTTQDVVGDLASPPGDASELDAPLFSSQAPAVADAYMESPPAGQPDPPTSSPSGDVSLSTTEPFVHQQADTLGAEGGAAAHEAAGVQPSPTDVYAVPEEPGPLPTALAPADLVVLTSNPASAVPDESFIDDEALMDAVM